MPVGDAAHPPPPGKLRQTVTYLEMTARPDMAAPPFAAAGDPSDGRLEAPVHLAPDAYRALYRAVGERWLWWERLVLTGSELAAVLDDPRVETRLFRVGGDTAGFSEIDRRAGADDVEIAFLGLKPAFTGRRLGRALLAETLRAAWTPATRRVWLHTCDHDHPGALGLYRSAGFRVVLSETVLIDDPRFSGLLPRTAAPHIPPSPPSQTEAGNEAELQESLRRFRT